MIRKTKHEGSNISANGGTEKSEKSADSSLEREKLRVRSRDSAMVTWLDKYAEKMDKYWSRLPNFTGPVVAGFALFLMGACFRGEWLLILVHFARLYGYRGGEVSSSSVAADAVVNASAAGGGSLQSESIRQLDAWEQLLHDRPYLRDFGYIWLAAIGVGYSVYVGLCTYLHWYFYVRRRDQAEEWKCQPYKWLSPDLERHEMILGFSSLFLTSTISAIFATYVYFDGPSMVYFDINEYGWLYWLLQWPGLYILMDYQTYWFHRLYHRPTLYKMFHKLHHTYKQPTAWSVTAIHPVEIIHMQLCYLLNCFIIPIHLIPLTSILIYNFIHGIIDHSGINFKAQWWQPWQPDAVFHDNHHQYTHVNFGFNMFFWDKLHGTYRLKDRIYNEDIFYGQGKKLSEATAEELAADLEERDLENEDNKVIFCLDTDEALDEKKSD